MTRERHPERNAEIRRLHAEGVSLAEIGARFGISRQRVHQVVNPEADADRKSRWRKQNPTRVAEDNRKHHNSRYGIDMEWTERRLAAHRAYRARRKAAQSSGAAE